jgi:site-specific recombinase XerD
VGVFYAKFETLTRGSTVRRIRHRRSTHGEGWQAEFAASLANSGLAPLTVRAYRHDVSLFLKWFVAMKGGESRLSDLTTADVMSYRQHLVGCI